MTENSFVVACAYDNTFHLQSSSSSKSLNQTVNSPDANSNALSHKPNSLAYKKALYIFPITFYVCEIYYQEQLISTQNLTIHNPYTNSYLGGCSMGINSARFKNFMTKFDIKLSTY